MLSLFKHKVKLKHSQLKESRSN